jgi:hypothetical protein
MKKAIVSGDIIASTSLNNADRSKIGNCLKLMTKKLNKKFNVYSRLTEGNDYIDSYIPNNSDAIRVMLAIKCFVKSIPISINDSVNQEENRSKYFKMHGIRLALGIGELSRLDIDNGIIDGDAIYFSGRTISENRRTYNREKIVIKNTLFIKSEDKEFDEEFTPLLALLDVLLSKCTAKQSTVLYLKLLGYDEATIARVLGKKQSTINEHSTGAGWIAIEKAVIRFEEVVKTKELEI